MVFGGGPPLHDLCYVLEALKEIRADLHLRLQCVNLAVAQPGRQAAQSHQIRRIPASEVHLPLSSFLLPLPGTDLPVQTVTHQSLLLW